MRKKTLPLLALALWPAVGLAQTQEPPAASGHLGTWALIPYGTENPTLNCSPLGACVVALEDGETIESRFLPDSARWQVEPGTTGPNQRTPLLAIKPKECGIASNLIVSTDRRVYTFLLNAPPCDPDKLAPGTIKFDQIRFTYPESFALLWQPAPKTPAPALETAASRLDQLNFDYSFSAGRKGIEPRIVYDDGAKTYIVLREEDLAHDAPAVFLRGEHGRLEAVNFSPPAHGSRTYTVDRVAKDLVLVSGPSAAERTLIRNRKGR
ncbi:MAG TPA: TrbG/VirB9 family P-type conjugative transfer protein [Thermoanaerobaculia bacterium]|nr:TrbG/VirB9 family P-type conjugative transfer protein [Thermoanaerobaculia bacterium]